MKIYIMKQQMRQAKRVNYLDEHLNCLFYNGNPEIGFRHLTLQKGKTWCELSAKNNYFFFLLEGTLIVDFNECVGYEIGKGEMIYLPRSADFRIFAKESADLIILSYGIPVQLCDKLSLSQLGAFVTDFKYEFKSLDIRVPLDTFLKLLVKYLDSGMNCQHMHELKQKELFLILRAYYTKEEKMNFFYHSIAASLTFKDKVMGVYLEARTVQELADKCGYGLKTFQRLFYNCFSEVPSKWLMKQKAQHVKARLLDKDIPIKVILDEFGFSTYANFCNYCKRYVGDTPRNIRESVTGSPEIKR